ncbi:hypothetical protein NQZ68_030547 [Dissostichus eleginoides]|nr:hypothetical protein NQZ68_030547 [Dissostichus eleginoides]
MERTHRRKEDGRRVSISSQTLHQDKNHQTQFYPTAFDSSISLLSASGGRGGPKPWSLPPERPFDQWGGLEDRKSVRHPLVPKSFVFVIVPVLVRVQCPSGGSYLKDLQMA